MTGSMTCFLISRGDLLLVDLGRVLGRDDDGVDARRHAEAVLDGHLALAVGAQPRQRAVLADLGQAPGQAVRQRDGQRHQLGRLVAGVAEHHALVAGAGVQVVLDVALLGFQRLIDAHGDVARLARQDRHDLRVVQIEAAVRRGVADAGDDAADDLVDDVVRARLA